MKKIILITLILIIAALIGSQSNVFNALLKSNTAYAVGDLLVDWGVPEGNPIFTASNMVPGDSENHTVTINNGATTARPVGVRGILTSQTGSISDKLHIIISENGTTRYGPKTLTQFFTDSAGPSGIDLSTVSQNTSTNYLFAVTFDESAGNEFQNKQVVFDLRIGIAFDVPTACSGIKFQGDPIFGTIGNDKLSGGAKNEMFVVLEGNDKVSGGAGKDCIIGGTGNDTLEGGSGDDVMRGGEGNDALQGGAGSDTLDGNEGNNTLNGDSGKDTCLNGIKKSCEN